MSFREFIEKNLVSKLLGEVEGNFFLFHSSTVPK